LEIGILTNAQLEEIEREVDEIIARADVLDPQNPRDAEVLYFDDLKLIQHISVLEQSFKKTRIKESGLRVISSSHL